MTTLESPDQLAAALVRRLRASAGYAKLRTGVIATIGRDCAEAATLFETLVRERDEAVARLGGYSGDDTAAALSADLSLVQKQLDAAESALRQANARIAEMEEAVPGPTGSTLENVIRNAIIDVAARPPGRRGPYKFDEDWLQKAAEGARAALAAAQPHMGGEPVAWMTDDGRVATDDTKRTAMAQVSRESFSIPLYLAPSASPDVAALIEAARDLRNWANKRGKLTGSLDAALSRLSQPGGRDE